MSVSTIDGTLETANLKRRTRIHSVYDSIVIRRDDGGEERLAKAVVGNRIADALRPGTHGRFYLYKSIDYKGVHGIRAAGDVAVQDYPANNERLMLMVLVMSIIMVVGRVILQDVVWLLPLGLIVLAAITYPLYRKTRIEARQQFDRDSAYAAPAAA